MMLPLALYVPTEILLVGEDGINPGMSPLSHKLWTHSEAELAARGARQAAHATCAAAQAG